MNKARKIACFTALALTGLVAACSDAVPPAAQGAVSYHVASPAMAGASCPANPHWSNAPFISNMSTTQTVTLNQKGPDGDGPLAIDGQSGAVVKCSVKASGDKFVITARISGPVSSTSQPNQFTVSTTLGPNDTTAAGTISVSDQQTGSPFSSSACVIAARPTTNGAPGVAPGKVWASATCTNAADVNNAAPNARCDFSPPAVFVFENCDQ